jgi:hypothetical protein
MLGAERTSFASVHVPTEDPLVAADVPVGAHGPAGGGGYLALVGPQEFPPGTRFRRPEGHRCDQAPRLCVFPPPWGRRGRGGRRRRLVGERW